MDLMKLALVPLLLALAAAPATRAFAQEESPDPKAGDGPGENNDPGNYNGGAGDDGKMGSEPEAKPAEDAAADGGEAPKDEQAKGDDGGKSGEKPLVSIKVESEEKPVQAAVSVAAPEPKKKAKSKKAAAAKPKKKAVAVKTPPAIKKAALPPPPPPPPAPAVPPTPVEPFNP